MIARPIWGVIGQLNRSCPNASGLPPPLCGFDCSGFVWRVYKLRSYLGGGWFIQSSGNGVDVVPLEDWYYKRFAWGRRPLAEAGLS